MVYLLKCLISKDQENDHEIIVKEIKHLSKEEQAEKIAYAVSSVSQEYEQLQTKNINVQFLKREDIPVISVKSV